ncbi:MAG: Cytochrome c protein [Steroidobacteraceae bacterium]|nr:Cytochrome c protein [Steroidobacteraceae bacterium]
MKSVNVLLLAVVATAVTLSPSWIIGQSLAQTRTVSSDNQSRMERFRRKGVPADEGPAALLHGSDLRTSSFSAVTEAPTGFDNRTNGFNPQGPAFDTLNEDNVVPLRSFNDNRFIFEETEGVVDGLGPTYNAQSCRECHQNVATGGASQVAEHRTGQLNGDVFYESLGGSLIHSRATHPAIVETVAYEDDIRTFRISTNTLGSGFVEAIANSTLLAIRDGQPAALRGTALMVPVLEASSRTRIGRFGWKSQHASLESFSADAYLNEMGITTPLLPDENTSSGEFVGFGSRYDKVADPEDDGVDVIAFANFMRATKAPSRGPINANVIAGGRLFAQVGCAGCHVPAITTARPGTLINGGAMKVPNALGNKIIHPYSDFLLHDIGTGDGIPFLPTPEYAGTAKQIRTAPLWALRTRNRLMHDGLTSTKEEAIQRHAGQAVLVTTAFNALTTRDQALVLEFLDSL